MNTLLWVPCATVILTICTASVRSSTCGITLCSLINICGNGRECYTDPDTCQMECICMDNVTHELCRANKINVSTNSPVTLPWTIITVPLSQDTGCLSNYTQNNVCPGGLPCRYGDCVTDNVTSVTRCECYPGAVGDLCDEPCCLDCGPHGVCTINRANSSQFCGCHPNYTGESCAIPKPIENTAKQPVQVEKETWYLWLVGVCAVLLFVLLLLLIVLPYLMWKHRIVLIMKIVHYFQPYEDQDDRIYDAFVSYRSDPVDEEFVLRKLIPALEKEMDFKLNIHLRDFAVGETIANNIIQAVQNSRRTILVLSKNYVKSEFTRFEYQCAQQEMLQKKHRVIPILLEDITEIKDTIDPNLKVILNSVTYIMWPGENNPKELQKFWKRLELSMPKIRKVKNEGIKVKQDMTVWPENITIHATDGSKHGDVFNSAKNKSVDEEQGHKVTTKDDTGNLDTNNLDKRLSTLLSNIQL
ncbi:hypothetical protein CHS0354_027689 [Potamilus streckersoni]|uniref:TIR domain-containing protein n=1 Tax=Potamilus streckersoni TaxID=2493646 RepID=A0AAE0T189_9BIVA|nr:hypothetical protein CHS0354_027689 [Potamilus streckersoni]